MSRKFNLVQVLFQVQSQFLVSGSLLSVHFEINSFFTLISVCFVGLCSLDVRLDLLCQQGCSVKTSE